MSRLAKAIRAEDMRERRAILTPISALVSIEGPDVIPSLSMPDDYLVFEIAAKFGATQTIRTRRQGGASGEIEAAKDAMKRAIVEAVFGEFRMHFVKVRLALGNYDTYAATEALGEFQRDMYDPA